MSLLGFDALGRQALGQITNPPSGLVNVPYPITPEPVRSNQGKGYRIAMAASGGVIPPLLITPLIQWFAPLSEPSVKAKIGLKIGSQPFLSFQPTPIINITWFDWLSEPVRKKPGLTATVQPFFSLQPTPIINIGWFNWFSEPVRKRPGLLPTVQPFLQEDPLPFVSFGWFGALSDPVRFRPRLREGLQKEAFLNTFIPTNYTARLDATETPDRFLGILYQFNLPLNAYVDIIENDPRVRGFMGIIGNTAKPSILASISEPAPVSATGSPISTVAGARVAIIVQ